MSSALLTRVCLLAMTLLIPGVLFITSTSANPERERERSNSASVVSKSANLDLIDHLHTPSHHDDETFLSSSTGLIGDLEHHSQGECEPIKIGLCMGVGYNQTTMPNLVGHDIQADADALLQTFTPLIQYGCSRHLKLFLCSAYVPMCTDKVPQPIGPCRALCESVRSRCEPVLTEFGFKWPPSLECSKFYPENNHQHMCIPDPEDSTHHRPNYPEIPDSTFSFPTGNVGSKDSSKHQDTLAILRKLNPSGNPNFFDSDVVHKPPVKTDITNEVYPTNVGSGVNTHSGHGVINNRQNQCVSSRKIWTKGSCWIQCSASSTDASTSSSSSFMSLFHPSEKSFARSYASLWAILSLSSAMIALTLSVCSPRFSVAERPILYLALCQVMFSIGVIAASTGTTSCWLDKSSGLELLASKGVILSSCAVVFLLTYFFGTAATLWWVILCLSWILAAVNRNIANSLLQKESSIFHLICWGFASVLTSTALVHKKVDADELTGICGVGFQDTEALTYYNLIPLIICLTIGLLSLLSGLLFRIFPRWNQSCAGLGTCLLRNSKIGHRIMSNNTSPIDSNTGIINHGHLQSSFRAPTTSSGYTPVFLQPTNTRKKSGRDRGQLYIGGNSPASVVGINSTNTNITNNNLTNGLARKTASSIDTSKAVWMRVGIFSLVHSLPLICQVGTLAYEIAGREDWELGKERPNLQIFLLRLNMNLIAGLTTGVWVLSTYSWKSLSHLTQRFCCCIHSLFSRRRPQKLPVPNSSSVPLLPAPLLPTSGSTTITNVNLIPTTTSSSSSSHHHNNLTHHQLFQHNQNHSYHNNMGSSGSTLPVLSSNNTFTTQSKSYGNFTKIT